MLRGSARSGDERDPSSLFPVALPSGLVFVER